MIEITTNSLVQFWSDATRNIHLEVAFASRRDEMAFSKYPEADRIRSLVKNGVSLTGSAFMLNGILRDQKFASGYRNRADVSRSLLMNRLIHFMEYFYFGVAGAISVIDRIFDLTTEADWVKIPKLNKLKTLDFWRVASDGGPILLEAKGRLKKKGLNDAFKDISAKKRATLPQPAERLIGVTTLPANGTMKSAKCYLSDPPGDEVRHDAFKNKLMGRLRYYAQVISMFSFSFVLQSLSQRIEDLEALTEYIQLSNVSLVGRGGEPLSIPQSMTDALIDASIKGIVGDFFALAGGALLFIGLREGLIKALLSQNFQEINRYVSSELTQPANVKARIRRNEHVKLSAGEFIEKLPSEPGRVSVRCSGTFQVTKGGVVIGVFGLT